MTTNRVRLFGGAILTGALLAGTVGLALAQDPMAPSGRTVADMGGSGMTGGQGMTGRSSMTGSLTMAGSMNGAMGTMHASMTTRGVGDAGGR